MNEKIKTQIYLKASKANKRGEAHLYVQVRLYGKAKLYSTNKFISPADFDKNKCIVKSGDNAGRLNAFLRAELLSMDEVILNLENDRIPLTFRAITERYENPDVTFCNFSIAQLNSNKTRLAKKTFQKDQYHLNFINKALPEIRFHQVTKGLLQKLENIARKNDHTNNTIHGYLKTFRKYFYIAKSAGFIKNNPFEGYPIKRGKVKTDYLTMS
ncbi:MAG: phage integrase SAM-like domain-containing protein [Cytophagaceae bacterium]|nr:phage integrase SAM-like domain-containing protein [Cytophagaceae bacterium]